MDDRHITDQPGGILLPGPTLIMKCPRCAGLSQESTLTSGNTFGAKYWTDGAMRAPMLPRTPPIVKCAHWSGVAWADDFEEVASWDRYSNGTVSGADGEPMFSNADEDARARASYEELPEYRHASFADIVDFADRATLPQEEEFFARMVCWQAGNDARRDSGTPEPLSEAEDANLTRLLQLLVIDPESSALTRAEVLRELGRFAEARQTLDGAELHVDERAFSDFIGELIALIDARVRRIPAA